MFAYSLGIFVPLFILSFFYDKIHLEKLKWLQKELVLKIKRKKFYTNMPNIIAGIVFILIGAVFIIFRGTWIVNGLQMFGLRTYFYSWQNIFLQNARTFNIIGASIFILFAMVLSYFLVREVRNKGKDL
jgi:cytochrome c biogenesis protein CcdA